MLQILICGSLGYQKLEEITVRLFWLFIFALCSHSAVLAENVAPLSGVLESMETDRPDFTEGTRTVQSGRYQLEAGYTYTYDHASGVRSEDHTFPEALLRVGLLSDLELRLAWEGYSIANDVEGFSDTSLGIKHRMYDQDGLIPALSFIFETSIPTGESQVSADALQPSFKVLWAFDLTEQLAVAGNLNFDFPVEDNQRFYETAASFAVAYDAGFIEYFGFYPSAEAPESTAIHFLNGGFTLPLGENFQFDVRAGFGLNSEAADFFSGAGFSYRL